jgi:alternate signal-mediated exported protein
VVSGIVPGDAVTKECTFTVHASGDHVSAAPTVPSTLSYAVSGGTPTTLTLPVSATYSLAGSPFTSSSVITELDDGKTLTAQVTVTFPFGSGSINANDTQGLTAALDGLTVALTQTATGENPN